MSALLAIGAVGSAQAARTSHHGGGHAAVHSASSYASPAPHGRQSSGSSLIASRGGSRFARGTRFSHTRLSGGHLRFAGHSGGGIQCVTFARADSGIELSGNANTWWNHAEGLYERGSRPEPGSVLNFRANGAMHMGHVAVVDEVVNSRTVAIDHANWGGPGAVRGGISRDITVVDVSPNNDWSAVRVGLGHSGDYGSVYPTYGFIYNRPDRGVMVASNSRSPIPSMNPAPRDLRGREQAYEEVAEAPEIGDAAPRFGSPHLGSPRFGSPRLGSSHARHHVHLATYHARRPHSRHDRF